MTIRYDIPALRALIDANPDWTSLPKNETSAHKIANAINASNPCRVVKPRVVTSRTILAELPLGGDVQGAKVLDKLEAAGAAISAVKWAMRSVQSDGGLDVGHPNAQLMLDQLAAGGVLTQAETNALKALAETGAPYTAQEVEAARG